MTKWLPIENATCNQHSSIDTHRTCCHSCPCPAPGDGGDLFPHLTLSRCSHIFSQAGAEDLWPLVALLWCSSSQASQQFSISTRNWKLESPHHTLRNTNTFSRGTFSDLSKAPAVPSCSPSAAQNNNLPLNAGFHRSIKKNSV